MTVGWLPPWPVGLVAAVLAGVLLSPIGRRFGVGPASGAAATALYACGALVVELSSPAGIDGTAVLLLAVAAFLVVGSAVRNALAGLACVGAVLAAPVASVGLLVLLGAMTLAGGLVARCAIGWRVALGCGAFGAAGVVAVAVAQPDGSPALPPTVPAIMAVWTVVVVGLAWTRQPWLRPAAAAVLALLALTWVPGADADAAVLVAAASAMLTVVLVDEHRALLGRRALGAATVAAAVAAALLAPVRLPHSAEVSPGSAAPARVRPTAIAIPALGLNGPLSELTADRTGELLAPDDPGVAGWYAAGIVPGDVGPAVVGGHVDSRRGPGVFFALRTLRPGDPVEIARSDQRTARFVVRAVRLVPKDQFPTTSVYGPTAGPELRLVTCGGRFDRTARSYEGNVVVEAVLA